MHSQLSQITEALTLTIVATRPASTMANVEIVRYILHRGGNGPTEESDHPTKLAEVGMCDRYLYDNRTQMYCYKEFYYYDLAVQ